MLDQLMEAVQNGLVQRIAALDFNVVHLFRKHRIADYGKSEIILVFHPMRCWHTNDFVFVERRRMAGTARAPQ